MDKYEDLVITMSRGTSTVAFASQAVLNDIYKLHQQHNSGIMVC